MYNDGSIDKRFLIFYSISFYHKWISDVISGDAVRIAIEPNNGSPKSQIKPLLLFFSTLFFIHFWKCIIKNIE